MKSFSALLSDYIEASAMKQTRIAQAASISYNYFLRLIGGDRHPSEQVVYKIAEALRLSAEQTSELVAAAGYAPSPALLETAAQEQLSMPRQALPAESSEAARFVQQFYRLAQEVPDSLQPAFLEEMKHLLGYARYKYVFAGGAHLLDLNPSSFSSTSTGDIPHIGQQDQLYLNMLAQIVGELDTSREREMVVLSDDPANILIDAEDLALHEVGGAQNQPVENKSSGQPHSEFVRRIFDILRKGASWDTRYHITKALPNLCQLDVSATEDVMKVLRLDTDELYGADIRRRVIEALPSLLDASPFSLEAVVQLLHPVAGDDIYVALATAEICGDVQDRIKLMQEPLSGRRRAREKLQQAQEIAALAQRYQPDVSRIQRQLLLIWEGVERESIQYSMTLHDLLYAPDTLLLSLREGLQSSEKYMQIVATRYISRLLTVRPREILELYREILQMTPYRNVRRSVAKALPYLLHSLKETSLSNRTLIRAIISVLATDEDIFIRRALAENAMQLFYTDRDFLLKLLKMMHKDKDHLVRLHLQPVALNLAQFWLSGYAEAAGLIERKTLSNHEIVSLDNEAK
jgi:hypothetical protein